MIDSHEVGRLVASQDPNHPQCGAPWTSESIELPAGRHVLTIVSGRLDTDLDDVAFQGVGLMTTGTGIVRAYGKPVIQNKAAGNPGTRGWVEGLMDTTTLLATVALLSFMVERLTNGLAILLSYWPWWRMRMEVSGTAEIELRSRIERNRRVGLFAMSAVLAIIGSLLLDLNLFSQLGLGTAQSLAGKIATGLLIAAGADPIREAFQMRERRQESPPSPSPIQVSGTLVLKQNEEEPPQRKEPGRSLA